MAGLAGQQVAVELPQLRIGAVGRQQGHALVAAGLNQAGHQEAIELALRVLAAHQGHQAGAVGRRWQGLKGNAPLSH